jgi:hypothetical protein
MSIPDYVLFVVIITCLSFLVPWGMILFVVVIDRLANVLFPPSKPGARHPLDCPPRLPRSAPGDNPTTERLLQAKRWLVHADMILAQEEFARADDPPPRTRKPPAIDDLGPSLWDRWLD